MVQCPDSRADFVIRFSICRTTHASDLQSLHHRNISSDSYDDYDVVRSALHTAVAHLRVVFSVVTCGCHESGGGTTATQSVSSFVRGKRYGAEHVVRMPLKGSYVNYTVYQRHRRRFGLGK